MKKLKKASHKTADDVRPEYDFDFSKSKPNRFAAKLKKGARLVVLEPEVAAIFRDSDDVNKALRAFAKAMPRRD